MRLSSLLWQIHKQKVISQVVWVEQRDTHKATVQNAAKRVFSVFIGDGYRVAQPILRLLDLQGEIMRALVKWFKGATETGAGIFVAILGITLPFSYLYALWWDLKHSGFLIFALDMIIFPFGIFRGLYLFFTT